MGCIGRMTQSTQPQDLIVSNVTFMDTLSPLVGEYLRSRHARGEINDKTLRDTRYPLASFAASFGRRPLTQLGARAVDRWLENIGHLAPATRRNYVSQVRTFCGWLVAQGKIARNPTAHLKPIRQPRSQPRTLTPTEVSMLLASLPDERARAIVWLQVGCGCRCVEVSRLTVADYDPRGKTIRLVGKGGHERTIPVPDEAAAAIDAYLNAAGSRGGPLIRSHNGAVLSPRTISTYVRKWMITAGVKHAPLDGRSAHGLRRTAASDVMDLTGNIQVVQEMLGHSDVSVTARSYLRPVTLSQLREAMAGRTYAA